MPPDSLIEDISRPPLPFAQDYPSPPSDASSYSNLAESPAPRSPKSGFVLVFESSTSSGWARESSDHCNRSVSTPTTLYSSYGSTRSSSFGSISSFRSVNSQPDPWWYPGSSGSRGDGGDTWKRTRKYQTRLTAEECLEHAFGSPGKAHEREVVRLTISSALASSRPSFEVHLRPESQMYAPPATTAPTRRGPSVFFLGEVHERRTKGFYVPPPKGSFISNSTLVNQKRLSKPVTPVLPLSASSTSSSSTSSESPTVDSLSTLYSMLSNTTVTIVEPLLSREEWEKASVRRTKQRRRNQGLSSSCNGKPSGKRCGPFKFPIYADAEPLSISSQHIGGRASLKMTSTEKTRWHSSLRERHRDLVSNSALISEGPKATPP